jgi:hypothetical protein
MINPERLPTAGINPMRIKLYNFFGIYNPEHFRNSQGLTLPNGTLITLGKKTRMAVEVKAKLTIAVWVFVKSIPELFSIMKITKNPTAVKVAESKIDLIMCLLLLKSIIQKWPKNSIYSITKIPKT